MAAADRFPEPPVIEQLRAEPQKFNFYQLVRLLELLAPAATPVAAGADPNHEPVRFRSSFSLGFPPSDVVDLHLPAAATDGAGASGKPEVTVSVLGLGGAQGPLPHALTEWVLERIAAKDFALRDFLDIFHHRLVSLLYRVRRHSRLGMEWSSPEEHKFASYLMALLGLGTQGLQGRLGIPDRALLRYAGILSKQPRDATGLQVLLADYFAVPIRCLQLRGAMRTLDADQWTHLGQTGRNQILGRDAMVGTAVWDQQAGIELQLGPVPWAKYLDFLPGQPGLRSLDELARFYIGPNIDVYVTLLMEAEQIPPARLLAAPGATGAAGHGQGAALGLTAFLSHGAPQKGDRLVNLGALAQYGDAPQRTAQ